MKPNYPLPPRPLLLLVAVFVPAISQGQIVLDGTLGPAGPLGGPRYVIPAAVGQHLGGNLFHSFSDFNVQSGESATFTGPTTVDNVIGRVTGGSLSTIDGLLASEIAGADVYLINPAGIMFGANAQIDVGGSLKVSTADHLTFGDGGRFDARDPERSQLTVAPVESFGFAAEKPAAIVVDRSQLVLGEAASLSLIGGDIRIENGELIAPSGDVKLAAVASAGEVKDSAQGLDVSGVSLLADLFIGNDPAHAGPEVANIAVGGSGSIWLDGASFSLSGGTILSENNGDTDGGGVRINADRIALSGGAILSRSNGNGNGADIVFDADQLDLLAGTVIGTVTAGNGAGGDISIRATSVAMQSGATAVSTATGDGRGGALSIDAADIKLTGTNPSNGFASGLRSIAAGTGPSSGAAGGITISSSNLQITDGAAVQSISLGSGAGGDVRVRSERVVVAGISANGRTASLISSASGSESTAGGNAGSINIEASSLDILDGGAIHANSLGAGNAGTIDIVAERVRVAGTTFSDALGGFVTSTIQSNAFGDLSNAGSAGNVTLTAATALDMDGGSNISAGTDGSGAGGTVSIRAGRVRLAGSTPDGKVSTFIASSALGAEPGSGDAGKIVIDADSLELTEGTFISTSTGGTGNAGSVVVDAAQIRLLGARISSDTQASGDAGTIEIKSSDLNVGADSSISSSSSSVGDGGQIAIEADHITVTGLIGSISLDESADAGDAGGVSIRGGSLEVLDGGSITTGTLGGGDAGDVAIDVKTVAMVGDASITSATRGTGDGGDLTIDADSIMLDGATTDGGFLTIISSSSLATGNAGDLVITATDLQLRNGAIIDASAFKDGNGGRIDITAENLSIVGSRPVDPFASTVSSVARGKGEAGDIDIRAGNLQVIDGGRILTSTGSSGAGGDLTIDADTIFIGGAGSDSFSLVNAGTLQDSTGDGGTVTVRAGSLKVDDGGLISAQTLGSGNGGQVQVTASSRIELNDGAAIRSDSQGNATGSGGAGNVLIDTPLLLLDDAHLVASSASGGGGNVTITGGSLQLLGTSSVEANAGGDANGGNVRVSTDTVAILEEAQISAKAAKGKGGDITIDSEIFLPESSNLKQVLNATSGTDGNDGVVAVNAPELDISAGLVALPGGYLSDLSLQDRCGSRTIAAASSLTLGEHSAWVSTPDQWLLSDSEPAFGMLTAELSDGPGTLAIATNYQPTLTPLRAECGS